ncbi:MAG: lasso peptide biosynthesis B2 protein [Pyrinomonadaceae bacterium]
MALWVVVVSLLLNALPLDRALSLVTPRRSPTAPPQRGGGESESELARLLDMLLGLNFWLFTPTCWKRAPVLYRFLSLAGVQTRIVFGVRKTRGNELDGHAWLESGGRPVCETRLPNYTVTYSFPS